MDKSQLASIPVWCLVIVFNVALFLRDGSVWNIAFILVGISFILFAIVRPGKHDR